MEKSKNFQLLHNAYQAFFSDLIFYFLLLNIANGKTLGQVLLTTCVGSVEELEEMVSMIGPVLRKTWQSVGASANATSSASLNTGGSIRSNSQVSGIFGMKPNLLWNTESLRTLYHFVRCSQLEYVGQDGRLPIQVLFTTAILVF